MYVQNKIAYINDEAIRKLIVMDKGLRAQLTFSNYSDMSWHPSICMVDFYNFKTKTLFLNEYSVERLAAYGLMASDIKQGREYFISLFHHNELADKIFNNDYIRKTFWEIYIILGGM